VATLVRRDGVSKERGGGRLWAVNYALRRLVLLPHGTTGHVVVVNNHDMDANLCLRGSRRPSRLRLRPPTPAGCKDDFEQVDGNREWRGRGRGGLTTMRSKDGH